MNYRTQDFLKLIIPGLYVVAFVVGWYLLSHKNDIDTTKINDLTGIIVLLVPFIGFVTGYFIECVMAAIEHLFYIFKGRRPSKTVLSGGMFGLYTLAKKDKILNNNSCNEKSLSNSKAGEILQIAKQAISRDLVEGFRLNSMMARNIFGGQALITILYGFVSDCFCRDRCFYILLVVSLIFLFYWVHHTHVYVKYVLAEYGKTLK